MTATSSTRTPPNLRFRIGVSVPFAQLSKKRNALTIDLSEHAAQQPTGAPIYLYTASVWRGQATVLTDNDRMW